MQTNSNWSLSTEEKNRLIAALSPELATLRTKAEISQEELAELIGISRQTYGTIERGTREMSWSTFLSLVLFYDFNHKTHQMLRSIKAIPQEIMKKFNAVDETREINLWLFPIRMFSFEWFGYAGRGLSGCPSCFLCCYATSTLLGAARLPM